MTLPMPIPRETMERNHIGTMGRNYKRNPKPEYNEPKTSADVQPISKNTNPIVNKRETKKHQAQLARNHQYQTRREPRSAARRWEAPPTPEEILQGLAVSPAGDP